MNILFFLNGKTEKLEDKNFLNSYNKVVCVDGGYNNFKKLGLEEAKISYIVGDFDSIENKEELKKFTNEQVVFKDNQDVSDSEFAIDFILDSFKNIKLMDFVCCSSTDRLDHVFCNLLLLKKIPANIEARMIAANQIIYLLRDKIEISGRKGSTLSIVPITNIKSINTVGLKWQLNNVDLNFGFVGGVSNIIEDDMATISLKSGECFIFVAKI